MTSRRPDAAELAMSRIAATRGLRAKIAAQLGINRAAVLGWKRVPAVRVAAVSRITGIPAHDLRPDVFEPPAGGPVARTGAAG
jgi:DNA-binding transcriptional regulator YdaS (Cro superfamily)